MANFLTRIFGSRNQRLLRQYGKVVNKINALEESLQALDDAALRALLEGIDLFDDFAVLTQHPLVAAAKNTGQKIGHEGLLRNDWGRPSDGDRPSESIKAGILSAWRRI